MRICIDLDGVVAQLKKPGETYADVEPVADAVARIRELRDAGHTIILHTARHMKTTGGNVGAVMARQGKVTLDWLEKHGVVFHEIYFGKPWADVYIDDNALRFCSWAEIEGDGANLPTSSENASRALE